MTRRMFDSTTAADVPSGSELVAGYVDGSSRWSDADWQRFPGRILVRLAIFNDRYDAHVLDLEPGNNDAKGAIPWIREKWLRGETPTVYCFSDRGPHGYRISDVRSECDAASLRHPLFWITDFDNNPGSFDPAGDPEIVAKQYANDDLTGGHYDASVVADHWPGVDKEEDMTREEVIALLAEYGIDQYKVPALVKEFEQHKHVVAPSLSSGPIVPPFDGAQWFGSSADLATIGWTDPTTGAVRYFKDGVEVVTPSA